MITVTSEIKENFYERVYIGFLGMQADFENFSEEEKTTFLHKLKENKKVKLNNKVYEFDGQDYINFKKYYGVAIK